MRKIKQYMRVSQNTNIYYSYTNIDNDQKPYLNFAFIFEYIWNINTVSKFRWQTWSIDWNGSESYSH